LLASDCRAADALEWNIHVSTDSEHKFNIGPNLLDRNVAACRTNQMLAVNIRNVWTREGWFYLTLDQYPLTNYRNSLVSRSAFAADQWQVGQLLHGSCPGRSER